MLDASERAAGVILKKAESEEISVVIAGTCFKVFDCS